jgi:GntR family transcriptional regulator/MocR family aminotransferase
LDALFLDPGGASPLHRQLYVALRARILGGELEPGEQLPPTRSLARTLSLSRATVTEAYEQLRAEGYVKGRAGAGTYVASNIAPISMPPGSKARPGLSTWGRNVATFSTDPDHALDPTVCFDLRPHGVAGDVFPWDEWQAAVDAVLRYDRDTLLRYPPAAGLPDLQRVIAAHVRRYRAVQCVAEQVIVVNGAQQGLNLLAATLLAPGDHVAVENPGYPAASRALRALDLQVNRVPVDRDGLIVEALRACGPQKLIHVTPSHQDPTGVTMALSRRLALLEVARDFGSVVVEDDYDSEFRYEGSPIESLQSLDRGGHTVYMGSFSKSVLPGLRIGYMVVPPPLVAVMRAA